MITNVLDFLEKAGAELYYDRPANAQIALANYWENRTEVNGSTESDHAALALMNDTFYASYGTFGATSLVYNGGTITSARIVNKSYTGFHAFYRTHHHFSGTVAESKAWINRQG